MKKEDEKTKKEENKYLFYTQYYLTAGVYHVVNVVNSILNYSATYSSGVKEYLEEKVLLQKTIIDDIVADANKKKFEFDEDDYVIIKMRKAAVVVQSVVPLPVPTATHLDPFHATPTPVDVNVDPVIPVQPRPSTEVRILSVPLPTATNL